MRGNTSCAIWRSACSTLAHSAQAHSAQVLRFDPAGNVAILRPGQVCPPITGSFSDGTAYTETDTFQSGNLVVNGMVANMSLSASAQIVGGGLTLVCAYSITGTLQKISP